MKAYITKQTAKLKSGDNVQYRDKIILLLVLISWPHRTIYSTIANTLIVLPV